MAIAESEFTLEFRRNWRVLVVASCCLLFALSVPAFFMPFLYPEVIREFGWSREQAVVLASWKYVTGSVVAVVVGRFIDVIGVRRVMITVSALGGLALLSFLWTPGLAVYYAAGILLGFSGAGTMVSIKVLISRTFHASQGTAMGIAMLSTGIGQVIVPFAATFLIAAYGWRVAAALLSTGIWAVALPLMVFYLNDRSFEDEADPGARESRKLAVFDGSVASAFAGRREFWLIGFAVFAAGFVDQAFSQHLVLYLQEDLGLGPTIVASALSAIGLVGVLSRPIVGGLFDGLSVRGVSVSYLVLATA
ncbi:MAG: MFS transporter, partial [Gammaproteobacteria bacterium]|nr:MFS transporter [Gammaproteobacteria bacterium]